MRFVFGMIYIARFVMTCGVCGCVKMNHFVNNYKKYF